MAKELVKYYRTFSGKRYTTTGLDMFLAKNVAEARVKRFRDEGYNARMTRQRGGGWVVWHRKSLGGKGA